MLTHEAGGPTLPTRRQCGFSSQGSQNPEDLVAGDARAIVQPTLASIHSLFLNEHNRVAAELKTRLSNFLSGMSNEDQDELLFQDARRIIAAELQQLKGQALQQMGGGANLDPSMLPDELFADQAKRRVTLGLVLGEVMQSQNMSADPVRVRESIEELAATYESPEEVINWYYGNQEQLSAIESSVVEDQVFDYILGEAKVADKTVSYQEVIKPESKQPAEGA